jgi:PGF-CTERM protein
MTDRDSRSVFFSVSAVFVALLILLAAASAGVAGQSTPAVTFGSDEITLTEETEVPLVIENVPSDENVGSFELTVEHDSDVVNLSVAGTNRFDISTETSSSGGTTSTDIVGYTDQTDGTGGDVVLATITLSPAATNTNASVAVSNVVSVTDTNGNELSYSIGSDLSVSTGDSATGGGGGGAGGGGGGPGPSSNVSAQVDILAVGDGATASVEAVPINADFRVDVDGIISGQDIALEWIDISHRTSPDDYRIEMTNIGTSPTGDAPSLSAADPVGYLDISMVGAEPTSAKLGFTIPESAIPAGASADNLVVYHYDGGWQALDTEVTASTDEYYLFAASVDSLSPFAIGISSSDLSVTDASLGTESIQTGETATVSATVANDGQAEGTLTAVLQTESETIAEQDVSVAPGESEEITFEVEFSETGEYSLSVNDQTAGALSVTDSGGSDDGGSDGTDSGSDGGSDTGPDAEIPGFGVLAAITALLIGSLLLRRQ